MGCLDSEPDIRRIITERLIYKVCIEMEAYKLNLIWLDKVFFFTFFFIIYIL